MDVVHQTDRLGLIRSDVPARVDQVLCPAEADQPGQALGTARARDDAEQDFRLAESRVLGGEPEIGAHLQLEAASQAVAGDGGHGWDPELLELVVDLLQRRDHGLGGLRRHLDHHLDVGPGREHLLAAVDQGCPDVVPQRQVGEDLLKLPHDVLVDGVHGRTVEADDTDAVLDLEPDEISHGSPPVDGGGAVYSAAPGGRRGTVQRGPENLLDGCLDSSDLGT